MDMRMYAFRTYAPRQGNQLLEEVILHMTEDNAAKFRQVLDSRFRIELNVTYTLDCLE